MLANAIRQEKELRDTKYEKVEAKFYFKMLFLHIRIRLGIYGIYIMERDKKLLPWVLLGRKTK